MLYFALTRTGMYQLLEQGIKYMSSECTTDSFEANNPVLCMMRLHYRGFGNRRIYFHCHEMQQHSLSVAGSVCEHRSREGCRGGRDRVK